MPAKPVRAEPQLIGLGGALPDFKTVEVENGHVYDYTFASAPTDWRIQSGIWEMTNRWSCSPQWSWFGGRSEEVASVWNKRRFQGDISVQFYFAFKMGLAGTSAWHYHPHDIAVTISGDGKNLGSGYTFIAGADDNTRSVLMRAGKVVREARDPQALLPRYADGNPDAGHADYAVLHRHWWYVRINKIGPRVECWLDNKLLFTYHDSQPLDLGHIALWTYNNGMMLSRVQIYYEQELHPGYVKAKSSPLVASQSLQTGLLSRVTGTRSR
ncbi:MAG: hypothetical protein M3347_09985 [Armatimonadota bacterium]|nr:hypothetical protein [Armatimonadota bacterium]